jgi:hypothetical protein
MTAWVLILALRTKYPAREAYVKVAGLESLAGWLAGCVPASLDLWEGKERDMGSFILQLSNNL